MIKFNRTTIFILIVLNAMVLLGQIYPAWAPPFARVVNIIFLVLSLIFLLSQMGKRR